MELFRIDRGDSLTDISLRLKEAGLIRSTGFFKIYTFITGAAHRFQPGVYQFEKNDSLIKIVRALTAGQLPVDILIPEGTTLQDIDFKLSESGVIKRGDLVKFSLSPEMDDLRKEFWKEGEKKSKLALILHKISEIEKITAGDEEVAKEVAHILEHYKDADPERARMHAENVLTNEKIFQFLESQ